MELDSRKNEAKADLKQQDISIEVCSIHTILSLDFIDARYCRRFLIKLL